MNENEMIEEMASIICRETSNKGLCEKCGFKKREQFGYTYQCGKFDSAEALYNANYRKISDDEIIIKKSEYDILLKDYALTYDNAYQWGLKVGEEKTAIDILQELKELFGTSREFNWIGAGMGGIGDKISDRIEQFAKDKGIELEDEE